MSISGSESVTSRVGTELAEGMAAKKTQAGTKVCSQFAFKAWKLALLLTHSLKVESPPHLGTGQVNKSDEFLEKFQTALDPPLIFRKSYCGFRDKIATKVRMFIWRNFCVFYDPISHEMHVAQMFNMVIG